MREPRHDEHAGSDLHHPRRPAEHHEDQPEHKERNDVVDRISVRSEHTGDLGWIGFDQRSPRETLLASSVFIVVLLMARTNPLCTQNHNMFRERTTVAMAQRTVPYWM